MLYDDFLSVLNGRQSRKVGNNTYMQQRDEDAIAVKLHDTDVVTALRDGSVVLDSGGWKTVTTKDRMNKWLPDPWRVWTERGTWYLGRIPTWHKPLKEQLAEGSACIFADGITITANGAVRGYEPYNANREADVKWLKSRVKQYAKLYTAELPMPQPSGGDCWYCCMVDDKGKTMGDFASAHDHPSATEIRALIEAGDAEVIGNHIIAHIIEDYMVPSLAANALKEFGASQVTWWTAFSPEYYEAGAVYGDVGKADIEKYVSKYVLRRLGFGV